MNFIGQRSDWSLIAGCGGIILAFAMVLSGLAESFLQAADAPAGDESAVQAVSARPEAPPTCTAAPC